MSYFPGHRNLRPESSGLFQCGRPSDPAQGAGRAPFLIDLFHVKELAPLKELLETHTILGHNLSFEYKFLKHRLGIQLRMVWDTHSAFRVLDNNDSQPHYGKLGSLIEEELGIISTKRSGTSDWGNPSLTPEQLQYAADDVNFLHALKEKLSLKLEEASLMDTFNLEMLVLPVAAQLYLTGVAVDPTKVEALLAEIIPQVESSRQAVRDIFGKPASFNPNSNAQLLEAFQDDGDRYNGHKRGDSLHYRPPGCRAGLESPRFTEKRGRSPTPFGNSPK